MQILLFGAGGQVGQELKKVLPSVGNVIAVSRDEANLVQPESVRRAIAQHQPQVIVNAAAYTAVDRAESEPNLAMTVNAEAPKLMAESAVELGATLLHISTDYVFDGNQGYPYLETDKPNPLGAYGRSKQAGEAAIQHICPNHIVLRTAWVYGSLGKGNFVKTMLRLGSDRESLRVVSDQVGSPTWAADLARGIVQIIGQLPVSNPNMEPKADLFGIYHFTNSGVTSWYDFAIAIFEEAAALGFPLKITEVTPITTADYPTPARRPHYSVLAGGKLTQLLGSPPPHWRKSLRAMLKEFWDLSQTHI